MQPRIASILALASGGVVLAAVWLAAPSRGTWPAPVTDDAGAGTGDAQPATRLEVSLSERRLHEYVDGERVNTFRIAVGRPGHETPTGQFAIHRIDWNPDWTPPDSEWAEGEEYRPPGHPENPMGRVRMVYRAPYSIHGTEDLESLGRAASHGSIRMANDDIIALARRLMARGGADRPDAWFDEVIGTPTEMYSVDLPDPIPLINEP